MEQKWIPITDRLPDSGKYVLLSFENFSLSVVGRYEVSENGKDKFEGAFYVGDDFEPCSEQDLLVNAWMPLPEPYKPEEPSASAPWKESMMNTFLGGR